MTTLEQTVMDCSDEEHARIRLWLDRLRYTLAIGAVPAVTYDAAYFRYQVRPGQPRRHPSIITMGAMRKNLRRQAAA